MSKFQTPDLFERPHLSGRLRSEVVANSKDCSDEVDYKTEMVDAGIQTYAKGMRCSAIAANQLQPTGITSSLNSYDGL